MREIFLFEFKHRLTRLSTLVYFILFFVLAYFVVIATGGAFRWIEIGFGTSRKALVNSPFLLFQIISIISYFGLLVISAIMSQSIYQDFHHRSHALFFTLPISKLQYLGGRFLGAFTVVVLVFTSIGLGAYIGSLMPFVERSFFGPNMPLAYIQPYFLSILPNILFIGALFFCLAALSRAIFPVYIGSVVLLIGYMIASALTSNIDNKTLVSLLDPFGLNAVDVMTEYWTVSEQNSRLVPLEGLYLANRLIWCGIGGVLLLFTWLKFSVTEKSSKKVQPILPDAAVTQSVLPTADFSIIGTALRDNSLQARIMLFFHLLRFELKETIKNVYFLAILLCGVLFMFSLSGELGQMFGTPTWPVTYKTLDLIGSSFFLFILIIVTVYSGELVWRERDRNIHQLFDTLPVSNWIRYLSKLSALLTVQLLLLTVIMVCCIIIQIFQGYYHFEIGLYLKQLFLIHFVGIAQLCVLAFFVQVIVNHKYLGHFVMVLYYIASINMALMGFEHNLYRFGETPSYTYSDMNGYGHFVTPLIWFNLYWTTMAVILVLISRLFWVNGLETGFTKRLHLARQRLTRPYRTALAVSVSVFLGLGGFIYYNTNILNTYQTRKSSEQESVDYETRYKRYQYTPQARISDVRMEVDIFPYERRLRARGTYHCINKNVEAVDCLIINVPSVMTIEKMSCSLANHLEHDDRHLGFYIYRLSEPLPPGGDFDLEFDIAYAAKGFENGRSVTELVYNGTFINSGYLPSLGYNDSVELSDDRTRKKHELPERPRMPAITDERARMNTYLANDADWTTFEAIVSTAPDQIAIAPGYLQREWLDQGRRYFHYKMDSKILHFYSFLSARYQVKRDTWRDVALEIYYHPGHEYNLDRMMNALKKSLEYFTENFGPYQHRQVRIIEFPRYQLFAQSFPNTIPYSEGIGFIARVDDDDPEAIDYPFYVTAHELAHQWWAHQVIGANVQGATLMSESLAQYSSLMVMEQEYGPQNMRKFLKFELDSYLKGRKRESQKELPLYLNENQSYIHYSKGSLVMYALRDYLGEATVNGALSRYCQAVAFQEAPFTTSLEFLDYIEQAAGDDYAWLVEDLFRSITLYDNRTLEASARQLDNGHYETTLSLHAKKMKADDMGHETEMQFNDWIDIGIFGPEDSVLYLRKHQIGETSGPISIIVDQKPVRAGIDPYNKLIDRKSSDNTINVTVVS